MKTLTNIRIVVMLLVIQACLSGVNAQNNIDLNSSGNFEAPLIGRNYVAPPKGKGSPFLFDNWLNGYVVFYSGDAVKNKLFKFDCLKNEFIWMADGKSQVALDHHLIRSFALYPAGFNTERKFEKSSLKIPFIADSLIRYLEVLATGNINLYAFRRVVVYAETTHGVSGGIYQVNSYEAEPTYFVQSGNLPVRQVRFSKRSIREAYPEYEGKVKQILRKSHYGGLRNEYQLIQAIRILNDNWE
jgi:hypothetical protein